MKSITQNILLFISIFLSLLYVSCFRDVILLDLEGLEAPVVIESIVSNYYDSHWALVSRPVAFDEPFDFISVQDARVIISDDAGNSEQLAQGDSSVIYWTETMEGVPGRTYTLSVTVDGIEYMASSTMPEPLQLDTVSLIPVPNTDHYNLSYEFTDPAGIENYSRISVYRNGILEHDYLFHDDFRDGEIFESEELGLWIHPTETVVVATISFDRAMFDFLSGLQDIDDHIEDLTFDFSWDPMEDDYDPELPFFVPKILANPKSNLSNGALGYFCAQSIMVYIPTFEEQTSGE